MQIAGSFFFLTRKILLPLNKHFDVMAFGDFVDMTAVPIMLILMVMR